MSNDYIPRLSNKELLVLELLIANHTREMYGLELVAKSDERLKRGTIYVTLGRMQEKGVIDSRQEAEDPARPGIPRRLYKPTGYGMRVYETWRNAREQFLLPNTLVPGVI
jgi:DNA-binding PadR family transcriptional regulator